jgi:hypothetical protein
VRLALREVPGDAALRALRVALREENPRRDASALDELLLSWWLENE